MCQPGRPSPQGLRQKGSPSFFGFHSTKSRVDRSVHLVGVAFRDQLADHLDHAADLFGRLRVGRCRTDIHPGHVLLAFFDVAFGNDGGINALGVGGLDDLVVHVGEIGDVVDFVALVFQVAPHRIKEDHGAGIADMDQVVDRGAADVHPHLSGFDRYEFLLGPAQSVIDLHAPSASQ